MINFNTVLIKNNGEAKNAPEIPDKAPDITMGKIVGIFEFLLVKNDKFSFKG